MSLYLPDGVSQDDIDRAINGDPMEAEELCNRCNDYPCRCVRDEIEAEDDRHSWMTDEECDF